MLPEPKLPPNPNLPFPETDLARSVLPRINVVTTGTRNEAGSVNTVPKLGDKFPSLPLDAPPVGPLAPPLAEIYWPTYRHHILAALAVAPGLETIEDVERRIHSGAYQAWFGQHSVAITEVSIYDRRKALTVIHGGGDLAELLDVLEPAMCDHARRIGCDLILGTGRLGWKRPCEARGYKLGWIVMAKVLIAVEQET